MHPRSSTSPGDTQTFQSNSANPTGLNTTETRPLHSLAMADPSTCPRLTRQSVQIAHSRIEKFIHKTPVKTCQTLNNAASTRQSERRHLGPEQFASSPPPELNGDGSQSANPKVRLFLKCENEQRIGAFKARGAFHALGRLIDEEGLESLRKRGVCTHSSGNHPRHV